jgi:hypothetical protein
LVVIRGALNYLYYKYGEALHLGAYYKTKNSANIVLAEFLAENQMISPNF